MGMTDEDKTEIASKYKNGMTLQAIADYYGVSKQYIDQVLSRAKVERRPKKKVTPEMESQIKALAESGKTYSEISEATGVSRSTVCVICKPLELKKDKTYRCSKCGGTDFRANGAKGRICKPCSAKRAREYYHNKVKKVEE